MPITPYIILSTSDKSTKVKRFKTIELQTVFRRTDTIDFAADGSLDKQAGKTYFTTTYMFRVPEDVTDSDYGNREDLEYFLDLCNPHSTPSDVIVLTDHSGTETDVYVMGDTSKEPLKAIITNDNAYFFYKTTFIKKAA